MEKIYLDNGSTSFPKAPGLGEAMSQFIESGGYNIGRGGYQAAYDVSSNVLEARELIASTFGFDSIKNVIFTPGITYSINYLLNGLLESGDHVIISAIEHNAVARPCFHLKEKGVGLSIVKCDADGNLDIDDFKSCFKDNTKLVLMIHASNVCGTILNAEEVGKICKGKNVPFALDAAQTAGVVPVDFSKLNLSALCIAGHKGLLGPQGIGALLIGDEIANKIRPTIYGGTGSISHELTMPEFMPDHLEAGTLNLPGIIGLLHSLKYVEKVGIDNLYKMEMALSNQFVDDISNFESLRIEGTPNANNRVGIVSIDASEIMDNAELAFKLDSEYGIMTRCGLHCAPLAHKSLGTYPQGTVRLSFGHKNTEAEVGAAVDAVWKILREAK